MTATSPRRPLIPIPFRFTLLSAIIALAVTSSELNSQHSHPERPPRPSSPARIDSTGERSGVHADMAGDITRMSDTTGMVHGPLGLPMTRIGSGTSWLPDSAPMHAWMIDAGGGWELMIHGLAFVQYDHQGSRRGDSQFGSANWGMAAASHSLGAGRLDLRLMLSLEPWTVTARGYPLLLQSGEAYRGRPLHDRQHPHDLFMELAAVYDMPITSSIGLQLYVAPVGEPAIGPVAFPHRPSAAGDPLAPLGHHWQDATHISFGVLTGALYTRQVKLEGSIFNGREPDENRTNFDYRGRSLDSYAGRVTVNPSPNWSLSGSYAYLESPEGLQPEESQHRLSASILNSRVLGQRRELASAIIWGANKHRGQSGLSNSAVVEASLGLDDVNTIFGRAEYANKTAEELVVEGLSSAADFDIGSFVLGYIREIHQVAGGTIGLGFRGALNVIPGVLEPAYGTHTPAGFSVFLRLRPGRMRMDGRSMQGHEAHSMTRH